MRNLQDYMEKEQTDLFKKTNAFFAFSRKQFQENKKENINYISLGSGLICPKIEADKILNSLEEIYNNAILKDLKENGEEKIILRELYNYECFYTGDYQEVLTEMKNYPIENLNAKIKQVYTKHHSLSNF